MTRHVRNPIVQLIAFGSALLTALSMVAVCPTTASAASEGIHLGSIVIAVGIDASFASLVAAVKEGYFKKNGIDASIRIFPGGPEAAQAVSTGQADVTTTGQYSGPLAAARGADFKIIAEVETAAKQFGVVANQKIKKPQDLDGKTVAMQNASTSVYYYNLYANHYSLKNVKIRYVGSPQLVAALLQNRAAAYFSWQPYLDRGVEIVKGAHILNYSGDDNLMLERVYLEASKKVYTNPTLAKAILLSTVEASEWCSAHKTDLGKLLSTTYKAPLTQMIANAKVFTYDVNLQKPAMDELNRVADFITQTQNVSRPNISSYVDPSFLYSIDPKKVQ